MLGAATITSPLGAFDQHVIQRLRSHSFVASVLELFGIKTGYGVLFFVAAVGVAFVVTAITTRLPLGVPREVLRGLATAGAFAVLATQLPGLLQEGASAADLVLAAAIAVGAVAAVLAVRRIPAQGRMDPERAY